jgi:hypothetical protein
MRTALVTSTFVALALAASAPAALADDTTSTSLSAPSVPAPVWGQPVTFTATVTDSAVPDTHPAGDMQLTVDGNKSGVPVAVDANGKATLQVNSLDVGDRLIGVDFTGAGFVTSHDERHLTVGQAIARVVETLTPNPAVAGQVVLAVARVSRQSPGTGAPDGSVEFSIEGGPSTPPLQLTGGVAQAGAALPAGSFRIRSDYSGDGHFAPVSAAKNLTVNRAATATTLTSSATTVGPGQNVDLTAMVAVQPPGDVPTFGSLQFTADGAPIGDPIPLDGAAGVQITVTAPTAPGTYTIGVTYTGDDNTNASSATPVQIIVPGPGGPNPPTTKDALKAMGSTLIGALRKRGFAALSKTTEKFTAPGAGVLTQEIDSPKARASKAEKPIQIAKARRSFSGPGQGTLKLKLTAAGKRAIRKAKSLKIAIVTTYKPVAGEAVRVVQRLTVKARRNGKVAVAGSAWAVRSVHRSGPRLGQLHGRI